MKPTTEIKEFNHFALSDIGTGREKNEDAFGYADTANGHVFVVCDGIGGNPGGEKASRLVVDTITNFFHSDRYKNPVTALRAALEKANDDILNFGKENPQFYGLGTTCVLVLLRDNKIWYAHIGDSRIYMTGGKKFFRLTKDQTFVQGLIDKKIISEEEAKNHPRKNEIMQALGISEKIDPQISEKPILPPDNSYMLLCSDGYSSYVDDAETLNLISDDTPVFDKAKTLVETALKNGSDDNVTVQIIHFISTGNRSELPDNIQNTNSKKRTFSVILLLFLFTFSVIIIFKYFGKEMNEADYHEIFINQSNKAKTHRIVKQADSLVEIKILDLRVLKSISTCIDFDSTKMKTNFNEKSFTILVPYCSIHDESVDLNLKTIQAVYGINTEKILIINNKNTLYLRRGEKILIPYCTKTAKKQ